MAWPTSNHPLVHGSVSHEVLQQMPSRGVGVSRRKWTNGEKGSADDEPFIFCEVALFINTACVIQILSAGAALWTAICTVSVRHLLCRRQVHTEGLVARQLQRILLWVHGNHGLISEWGREFHCGGQRGHGLTYALRIR